MADFKDIQRKLQQAKSNSETIRKATLQSKERLNQLGRKKAKLIRAHGADSDHLNAILSEEKQLQVTLAAQNNELLQQLNVEAGLLTTFQPFTDPREHIQQYSDEYPWLLFPVRIETRFKKITTPGTPMNHQLWVRIFPDECSVQSFEDTLSESEVNAVKSYWQTVWAAGQPIDESMTTLVKNRKKAAWKNLAGSLLAGRAYWVTENYQPINLSDLPQRESKTDILLTIATEEIPIQANALKDYWEAYWEAAGAEVSINDAFDALESAVGSATLANSLIANYIPFNLGTAKRPDIKVWFIEADAVDSVRDAAESEVILKIVLPADQAAPPEAEALRNFWKAIWLADSNTDKEDIAKNELIQIVGSEISANQLIQTYQPNNLTECVPPTVTVSFIQFPKEADVPTKLSSWTRAAKATTLPDKFVLLGYNGVNRATGEPVEVLNVLGNQIPDPLIIGPDPSLDTSIILKDALIADYRSLTTDDLRRAALADHYQNLEAAVQKVKEETTFIEEMLAVPDDELDEALGQVFDNMKDDVKATKYIEYLCQRAETKWLFDFEEAVKMGMGFKVDLTESAFNAGFDRLFVLGVKLSADEQAGKSALEELLKNHHYGSSGLSILSQGTPTNNTEKTKAGFSENENSDDTFERYLGDTIPSDPDEFYSKKDGKILSEFLGIDPDSASLKKVENYFHTDQCEAKAMNQSLWPGTLGYFMDSMVTPVFDEEQKSIAKDYFTAFVSGRGNIPAIRIGDQPYGILPVSKRVNSNWLFQDGRQNLLSNSKYSKSIQIFQELYTLLAKVRTDFEVMQEEVSFVGKEGDAHQILLDVMGLHASSVEFHQRYAQSFAQHYNNLNLSQFCRDQFVAKEKNYQEKGLALLQKLGYVARKDDPVIPILEKFFLRKQNKLKGGLIDDQPLSETKPIRPYTTPSAADTEGENYIYWLLENAVADFEKIKRQQGFAEGAPSALLYQMLRHALILAFSDTALELYQSADILNTREVQKAKVDADFIPVREEGVAVKSRLSYLDSVEPRIASQNISVSKHISELLEQTELTSLSPILSALEHLKDVPTARLERAFVEHLDTCFYRLDAWLLGFVNLQLSLMRSGTRDESGAPINKTGIYLGAFGWVENLKPDDSELQAKTLNPELKAIFDPKNENNIFTDTDNAGYIHAPSINQAITAAVLRNAYITDATPEDPEIYKVNLSSERVRMALLMIEGMQQGQGLSELLGYQLERGLHDRYEEAEVDEYIYALREKFPLRNKLNETSIDETELESITQIEARNVVDGIKLIEHLQNELAANVNYSLANDFFPTASLQKRNIIDQEVNRILNIEDALADVAIAEGVHQVVQSNFDRAAGNLETYSKGSFPQMPEVIKTPRSGFTLTNRFGIHFKTGLTTNATDQPRVKAEPAINDFLNTVLPNLDQLACQVAFHKPNYEEADDHTVTTATVLISDLGLSQLDIFYLLDVDSAKSLTALDEYILKHVYDNFPVRMDEKIVINYTIPIQDKITIFELAPLLKSLRSLIMGARPLKSTDMLLPNEATRDADLSCAIDLTRIESAFTAFTTNFSVLGATPKIDLTQDAFVGLFDEIPDKDHLEENEINIIDTVDAYIGIFINRLHALSQFGIQQAGFGFVYDRKAAVYGAVYQKVLKYKNRWEKKQEKFDLLVAEEAALDPTAIFERIEVLQKMERTISTEYTFPVPTNLAEVNQYRTDVTTKRSEFDLKFDELTAFLGANFSELKTLFAEVDKIILGTGSATGKATSIYDLLSIEIKEERRQTTVLGEDMVRQSVKLEIALVKVKTSTEAFIAQHNLEANPLTKVSILTSAAQQLFGEDFKVIPEFNFTESQKIEIGNAYTNRADLLNFQKTEKLVDFPVDDWLYSVARVREKMEIWETTAILTENFKGVNVDFDLDLDALQLPYRENDSWLGLSYPSTYAIEEDKILYTAYLNTFNPATSQCGLLIDEWSEVIPTKTATTGLGFQYDQPNAEAPQTMLLVTPSRFTGNWEWDEITGALHETLDLARLRAVAPKQIDKTTYAQFLPATVAATSNPLLTIALNYAVNNGFKMQANLNTDG